MLYGRIEEDGELAAAKPRIERRAAAGAAVQRQRQRETNLRLLGQLGAVLVAAGILAAMYFL